MLSILAPLIWSHEPFNGTPSPTTAYLDAHPPHPPLRNHRNSAHPRPPSHHATTVHHAATSVPTTLIAALVHHVGTILCGHF